MINKYVKIEDASEHDHPSHTWALGAIYKVGDWVWNNGVTYKVKVAHTATAELEPIRPALAADMDLSAYVPHSLATAANDFLVASGAGAFAKKTLAEVKTALGLGSAAYTTSTDYATSSHNQSASTITTDTLDGDRLPAASTSKKGAVPVLSDVATQYLNGDGGWSTPAGGAGDVVGPASAINNRIVVFDGVTGKLVKDGGSALADLAVAAKGVTNGDSHDHNGGDGAQIAYSSLSGAPANFASLTELSAPADGDKMHIYDASAGTYHYVTIKEKIRAFCTSSVEQICTHGSWKIMNFGTIVRDTHSAVTTGAAWKFTAPRDDFYDLSCLITFHNGEAWNIGTNIFLSTWIDGSPGFQLNSIVSWNAITSSGWSAVSGHFLGLYLLEGQYIQVGIYQITGSNKTTWYDPTTCWISVQSS